MAAANRSIRHIFYAPTMRCLSTNLRISGHRNMATITSSNHLSKTSVTAAWNHDPSFPLPGNIGVDLKSMEKGVKNTASADDKPVPAYQSLAAAFFDLEDEEMRKNRILNQFVNETLEDEENVHVEAAMTATSNDETATATSFLDERRKVECRIQACPQSLVKEFKGLFAEYPEEQITTGESVKNFTVITVSQKTKNDMTSWSDQVEEERDELTGLFIENAKEICSKIQGNGFWADFIEPSSGHAFFGTHRPETLFETDDRLNQLSGFRVEDLGCCKVLFHREWQSNVFVGLIFTDAPVESHFFENL